MAAASTAAPPAALPAVRPPVPPQSLQPGLLPYGQPRAATKPTFRPAALRLDDQGREIDEFGNLVQSRTESITTLKVQAHCCVIVSNCMTNCQMAHECSSHSGIHHYLLCAVSAWVMLTQCQFTFPAHVAKGVIHPEGFRPVNSLDSTPKPLTLNSIFGQQPWPTCAAGKPEEA